MSKVLKKLRDKSGASIFISLLFFLFCLTIGGIILTASTANAGRLRNSRQAQQDYLTVSSAALLLRSICEGASFTGSATVVDGSAPSYSTLSSGSTPLLRLIQDTAYAIFTGNSVGTEQITIEVPNLETVSGTFSMSNDYKISISLWLPDEETGERYPVELTIPAVVQELPPEIINNTVTTDSGTVDDDGNPIMNTTVITTVINTLSVSWDDGVITKG